MFFDLVSLAMAPENGLAENIEFPLRPMLSWRHLGCPEESTPNMQLQTIFVCFASSVTTGEHSQDKTIVRPVKILPV